MTDADLAGTERAAALALCLLRARTRPADRRELARQLAHCYQRLADHYRAETAESNPFSPGFRAGLGLDPRD